MAEFLEETKELFLSTSKTRDLVSWRCGSVSGTDWKTNLEVKQSLNTKFNLSLDHLKTLTEVQILGAIRKESLFGVVECDIRVPDHLKPKFAEMPPSFENTNIPRRDIGEYMKAFDENKKLCLSHVGAW